MNKAYAFTVAFLAITAVWQILELIEFGYLQPSGTDSIITIVFAYSVYKNWRYKTYGR